MITLSKLQIEHLLAINELRSVLGTSIEPFASFCNSSVPSYGSVTRDLTGLKETEVFDNLEKIRIHKSRDITLFTKLGNIRLWRSEQDKLYQHALENGPAIMNRLTNR